MTRFVSIIFFLCFFSLRICAQVKGDTVLPRKPVTETQIQKDTQKNLDTPTQKKAAPKSRPKKIIHHTTDSVLKNKVDTGARSGSGRQTTRRDTAMRKMQQQGKTDSIHRADAITLKNAAFTTQILRGHPYFNFREKGVYPPYTKKIQLPGKEIYFYIFLGILLLFAVFKAGFDKYFSDLMNLFFKRSLKQRQLKQQVMQNTLPSLLFNVLFTIVTGFYIALLADKFDITTSLSFWKLFICCTGIVGSIYLVKYFVLTFIGWVFRIPKLTTNYLFLIFLVNKIIGIVLLPFLAIIALTDTELKTIAWTLSWVMIAGLFIYRFFTAAGLIRKENSVGFFHFLLYVSAFEIVPIIIIYKGISAFLN